MRRAILILGVLLGGCNGGGDPMGEGTDDGGSSDGDGSDVDGDPDGEDTGEPTEPDPCPWDDVPLPGEIMQCMIDDRCRFMGFDFGGCPDEFEAWEDAGRPDCPCSGIFCECETAQLSACLADPSGYGEPNDFLSAVRGECETWECQNAWGQYASLYAAGALECFQGSESPWPDCPWTALQDHLTMREEGQAATCDGITAQAPARK